MDWIHCNNCFLLPSAENCFYLTSCGHIYCRECEEKCARGQCKLCGNQCSVIVLSSSMKSDVQKFFTDPDELLKKKLKEVNQVSEFQKNHRARLVAHQRKQAKKFESVKQDFRKLLKNLKDVDGERKRLAQENDVLKKVIRMQQSPKPYAECSNTMNRKKALQSEATGTYVSPTSNFNSTLSNFMQKFEGSKAPKNMPQRVSVISPPKDGKLGNISPSPTSILREFHLNSAARSNDYQRRVVPQLETPISSPASIGSKSLFVTPVTPSSVSPSDFNRSNDSLKRKKGIVHPFSPNDM